MHYEYRIEGKPQPWAAPRVRGKFFYDIKHSEKQQTIWQLASQKSHETLSCPCKLDVTFYMPIPKSTSKIRKKQMLAGMICHISKPDRSNMVKFIEDCLQHAQIISNDSIIISGDSKKCWGEPCRTEIFITPLLGEGANYAYHS